MRCTRCARIDGARRVAAFFQGKGRSSCNLHPAWVRDKLPFILFFVATLRIPGPRTFRANRQGTLVDLANLVVVGRPSSFPPSSFFLFLSRAHTSPLPLCTACRAHVPERQVCSQLFATRWISTRKRSNFKRRRARSREYDFPLFALLSHHPSSVKHTPSLPSTINHTEWNGTRDRKKETKIPPIFLSHAKGTTISSSISESKGKEKKKKREGNIVDSFDQFARRSLRTCHN